MTTPQHDPQDRSADHASRADATGPIHPDATAPVLRAEDFRAESPRAEESQAETSATQAPPTTPPAAPRRERRRVGDIAVASVLAALLASGGTYAAIQLAEDGSGQAAQESAQETEDEQASGDAEGTTVSLTGEQDWASVADAVTPSTVSIAVAGAQGEGSGSGVVWDDEGHVVTNAHVVEGAQEVQVTLPDGRSYSAEVVGSDPSSDLAVLQLDSVPDELTPIAVGDDSALGVGDPVMAVGNPLGLSGTVTTGIVSALDRPVTTQGSSQNPADPNSAVFTNAIQTSAAINPGNSGGALVNAAGELVGINSSIASLGSAMGGQSGSIGIGFAIPSSKVQLIADQLIETGTATHAFLGVGLDDATAETDGATVSGAVVTQVEPDSPAAEVGLESGDLIVGIDDEPITSSTALVGQVRERGAGDKATIAYIREGERAEVTVTLVTRPDEEG